MPEEKRGLPPVKELLEQMYGVELHEPTPEELLETKQWMKEYMGKKQEQKGPQKDRRRANQNSLHGGGGD